MSVGVRGRQIEPSMGARGRQIESCIGVRGSQIVPSTDVTCIMSVGVRGSYGRPWKASCAFYGPVLMSVGVRGRQIEPSMGVRGRQIVHSTDLY